MGWKADNLDAEAYEVDQKMISIGFNFFIR